MKKNNLLFIIVLFLSLLLVSCGPSSDIPDEGNREVFLKEITIKDMPYKILKDDFDITNYNLILYYSDLSIKEIPIEEDMVISDFSLLEEVGTKKIDLFYQGVYASFVIDLVPFDRDITDYTKDIALISSTFKEEETFKMYFIVAGKKEMSSVQLQLKVLNDDTNIVNVSLVSGVDAVLDYSYSDSLLTISFVSTKNFRLNDEIFYVEFESNKQYGNFKLMTTFDNMFCNVFDNEVTIITNYDITVKQ